MEKYLLLIITLLLVTGCNINNSRIETDINPQNKYQSSDNTNETKFDPILVLSDFNYKVYSFKPGLNYLDLNFDNLIDNIYVSHIEGTDYYGYRLTANADIYNFFINRKIDISEDNYWNIVTKEVPGKKIDLYERDFFVPTIMGCNSGKSLRIVQTKNRETLLVLIERNKNNTDPCNSNVKFNIYKLIMSGNLNKSDYIFSFIHEVMGKSNGSEIDILGDQDIIKAIEEIKN